MALFRIRWQSACLAAALLAAAAAAQPAGAQDLQLRMDGGRVTLVADGAALADVLAAWSRVGNTRFVGAEGLDGGPLTLRLVDVPESRALRLLLQAAQGYVAAPRATPTSGTSRYDRVTILAGRRAAGAPPGPAAAAPGPAATAARGGRRDPDPAPASGPGGDAGAEDLRAQFERLQGVLDGAGAASAAAGGAAGLAPRAGAGPGAAEPNVALDHLQHLLGAAAGQQQDGGDSEPADEAVARPFTTPFPGMPVEPGAEPPPRRRRGGPRGAIPDPFTVVPAPPR